MRLSKVGRAIAALVACGALVFTGAGACGDDDDGGPGVGNSGEQGDDDGFGTGGENPAGEDGEGEPGEGDAGDEVGGGG
jgi:hypothetical protein